MFVVTLGYLFGLKMAWRHVSVTLAPRLWSPWVTLASRVARWFVFKPKIQILVNFANFFKERYK
jgi:hypothetical protein